MERLTEDEREIRNENIVRMHEKGLTQVAIAKVTGLTRLSVHKILAKRGCKGNKRMEKLGPKIVEAYCRKGSNYSYDDIAAEYGVSYPTAKKIIKASGQPLPHRAWKRARSLTKQDIRRIRRLRKDGISVISIAAEMDIARQTVYHHLNKGK